MCSVSGCLRPIRNRQLCSMHYQRWLKQGDAGEPEPRHILTGWKEPRPAKIGFKWCQGCFNELPVDNFHVYRNRKDGRQAKCILCKASVRRQRTYGLTPEKYQALLNSQHGVCAICHDPDRKLLHVDHDHACCPDNKSCGKCVRAILCSRCNHVLGLVHEDVALIKEYSNYLLGWELQWEKS